MTALTFCPTDESTLACPDYLVDVPAPVIVPTDPPDPGPGVPPWTRGQYGPRVQVRLCRPVTHDPICELRTARVESWTDRFGKGEASLSVHLDDPGWLLIPQRTVWVRGRRKVRPDLKAVEVTIGLDGQRMWSGILQDPVSWVGPRVQFKATSAEGVFEERTLGETEQPDFYHGRGSFPTTDLTGFEWDDPITTSWVTGDDAYEGGRSLRLTTDATVGGAWFYGPWTVLAGQEGQVRYPVASCVVKSPDAVPVVVGCYVEALDGSAINPEFTTQAFGDNDDANTDWQVVAGRGRMLPENTSQKVRFAIHLPRSVHVDIDLVQIQWPTLTGFPSNRDLSLYPGKIVKDAQASELGGCNYGIHTKVLSLTGIEDHLTWAHQEDHPVNEAIDSVTDMDGGPDKWLTPSWRMLVAARRGSNRADVALSDHRILSCTPNFDPAGQVDELRATTDIGTGSYRHVFAHDGPRRGNRRRIRKLVIAPPKLDFDGGKRWTEGQGKFAEREPVSASVEVDMAYGLRFNVGDGVPFTFSKGNWAEWEDVRIGERTVRPLVGRVSFQVGLDPVVSS